MHTLIPEGYTTPNYETLAKYAITLSFPHKHEDLVAILGLPGETGLIGRLHTAAELRSNGLALGLSQRLDEQYYLMHSGEDGWSFIHFGHPILASRFISLYDSKTESGRYHRNQKEFRRYLRQRAAKIVASDIASADVVLEDGKKIREEHRKMGELFELEERIKIGTYEF
ncbi:hypothetical protein HYY70_06840 [Candidatus Woesearchaeota archaeon]|nr:hypothetical protein [Candidatus Woesearchaeota archaeon]